MILLEAAASRFALAAAKYGVVCEPEGTLRESAQEIKRVSAALTPLSLPDELRDFWTWWTPEQFTRPAFDGFFGLQRAELTRNHMRSVGYPEMLIPVAKYGRGLLWMELQSDAHFGSRIYYGGFMSGELRLWTIGISGLLDVATACIERDGVISWGADDHRLNPATVSAVVADHAADLTAPEGEWRVQLGRRATWPAHWHALSKR